MYGGTAIAKKGLQMVGNIEKKSINAYNNAVASIVNKDSMFAKLVAVIKKLENIYANIKKKDISKLFEGVGDGTYDVLKNQLNEALNEELKNAVSKIPGGTLALHAFCTMLKNIVNILKEEYKKNGVKNSKVESFFDFVTNTIERLESSEVEIKISELEEAVKKIQQKMSEQFPDFNEIHGPTDLDKEVASHVIGDVVKNYTDDFKKALTENMSIDIKDVNEEVGVTLGGRKKSKRSVKKSKRYRKSRRSKRLVKKSKKSKRRTMKRR